MHTRRDLLAASGLAVTAALAGCNALSGAGPGETTDAETTGGGGTTGGDGDDGTSGASADAAVAVAAEWTAMRGRLFDAAALGAADEAGAGARVAADTFARFENAGGEWGAHERLEATSHEHYEGFEGALADLRGALDEGEASTARQHAAAASGHLYEASEQLVGERATHALDLLVLGARLADAGWLADAGAFRAAAATANAVLGAFEDSGAHDDLEAADAEAYEAFEGGVRDALSAARGEDADGVEAAVQAGVEACVTGAYAIVDAEARAGAGHLALYQARGFDAAALASMGGPGTGYAHAAALTTYRARARDAAWLHAAGERDAAKARAQAIFEHFEGTRAHEALEEADHEAYEGFEHEGLESLVTAIEDDDAEGVASAVATVDESLRAGVSALGTGPEPAVLEASFFAARLADARERYRRGEGAAAADVASALFEAFEANHADFHERLEETSEELYHSFEEEHLAGLIDAFESGDDAAVETHHAGAQEDLLTFQTEAGTTAHVAAAQSAYMSARGFDAGVLAALGANERAAAVAEGAFGHFEEGAGGFHEALEHADHGTYESFEEALGGVQSAASDGGDVATAVAEFDTQAVAATYAVVAAAGGSYSEAATGIAQGVFQSFEEARVHGALEEADQETYESFEGALSDLVEALDSGGDVGASAAAFADATLRAQFAVAGALGKAPAPGEGGDGGRDESLSGGPNVVAEWGDADHVVEMQAVAFEPADLTVQAGDTVAFVHAGGEAHTVTAYEGKIPDGATYWASGGFESQDAAETGWEDGKGAVQSGRAYVRTFETAGEHHYFCVPHEAAGMTGVVTVE